MSGRPDFGSAPDVSKSLKGAGIHMLRSKFIVGVFALGLGLLAPALRASDFVGVYCLVDKVVLEPNDTEPQRVQIWGAFLMTDGQRGGAYAPVQHGYLYYTCPQGKDATCMNEWADLKSLAGTGKGVGFGARFQPNGHVRRTTDAVALPDAYPVQMGLVRLGTDTYAQSLLAQLKGK
jgi:hypothetical protein